MKEKDKKNPFNFSLDFKNWDNTKPITFSHAFERAEKDYFIYKKYDSLQRMYIYEKDKAEIAFEEIYAEVINAVKIVDTFAPVLGKKLVKTAKKKTKPKTGRTQKTIDIRRKIRKNYYKLTELQGLQPRKAKEILAKKYGYKVSTINTYLNEKIIP